MRQGKAETKTDRERMRGRAGQDGEKRGAAQKKRMGRTGQGRVRCGEGLGWSSIKYSYPIVRTAPQGPPRHSPGTLPGR